MGRGVLLGYNTTVPPSELVCSSVPKGLLVVGGVLVLNQMSSGRLAKRRVFVCAIALVGTIISNHVRLPAGAKFVWITPLIRFPMGIVKLVFAKVNDNCQLTNSGCGLVAPARLSSASNCQLPRALVPRSGDNDCSAW